MFGFMKQGIRPEVRSTEKVHSTYRRRQAGVLAATSFTYIAYYIIRLVFTTEQVPIMNAYGFSIGQIGLILSTFGIGYGIAKIFMGALVDRMNARLFLAIGLYLSAFFNLLIGFTQNFALILVLMLLIAMTQAMGAPACQRQISIWFSKRYRGSIFSIWASAHNAGAFLCVASVQLATFIYAGSLTAVFVVSSVISSLIVTLMLLINTDKPESVGLPDIASHSGYVEVDHRGHTTNQTTTDARFAEIFVQSILLNKVVWMVTLTSMSIYIVRYGILSWIPSYLPTKGFSITWAKWFVGIFELSAVPGVIAMGALSDFLNGRRALICLASALGMLACLAVYFTSTNQMLLMLALFLLGTLIYTPLSLVGLMVNEAVPNYALGLSTGFMGFFQYIFGETIATALIGYLVQLYGWNAGSYIIYLAALVAITLLVFLVFKEQQIRRLEMAANQGKA
ncbi:glycerol-3-phosphate transport protein [Fructobacillus pseudoficulneus]|uniref:Glycerol-3-phosphate transport protein n=1 Tax=Fructobacillus pseudoficulneus TaxID=220714 RepID=A0A3F3GSK2_9LACO|nr:MFS transporter [Fructobacillus pseudoficulneus]GAP02571.1 glycerol-3-phosphate transport protein [Fructobacillus pseudoficulneus]SEH38281.1 MFS transporter, OPA family, glycerol-3-phosphate transporter [Fructobacillus pseudoficulneus]